MICPPSICRMSGKFGFCGVVCKGCRHTPEALPPSHSNVAEFVKPDEPLPAITVSNHPAHQLIKPSFDEEPEFGHMRKWKQ